MEMNTILLFVFIFVMVVVFGVFWFFLMGDL